MLTRVIRILKGKLIGLKHMSLSRNYDRLYGFSLAASVLFHVMLFLLLPPDFYKLFYSFADPQISLDPFTPWGVESPHRFEVIPIKVLEPKPLVAATKKEKVPKIKVVEEVAVKNVEEKEVETSSSSEVETNVLAADQASDETGMAAKQSMGFYMQPIPKVLYYPKRPKSAKKNEGGTVHLLVHVTSSGEVDEVKIERGLGNNAMNQAAVDAAMKTVFNPAIREGTKIPTWTRYAVTF